MPALSPDWIKRLHAAVVSAGLEPNGLTGLLPADVKIGLPVPAGNQAQVLLGILNAVNQMAKNGNVVALTALLDAAEMLAAGHTNVLAELALARVEATGAAAPAREPADSSAGNAPSKKALREYLQSAYSASDLRIFVSDTFPNVVNSVNWNGSITTVAFDVVETLGSRGLLNRTLRDALLTSRPGRATEIDKLF